MHILLVVVTVAVLRLVSPYRPRWPGTRYQIRTSWKPLWESGWPGTSPVDQVGLEPSTKDETGLGLVAVLPLPGECRITDVCHCAMDTIPHSFLSYLRFSFEQQDTLYPQDCMVWPTARKNIAITDQKIQSPWSSEICCRIFLFPWPLCCWPENTDFWLVLGLFPRLFVLTISED